MLERTESLVEELRFVTDGLAHDLRSPLMRIRASVDRAAGAADPQSCQSALDAVSNQIESMLQMLNRTLEVSRAEAGIGRENFEPVDLVALARDLCEMYQPLAEDGGVSVRLEAREPAVIPANRELLGQALANLVDNALKYASAGGIVSIGVSRTPTTVRLGVADRGPGIAEAMRSEAVRKYRRLDPARTSDGSGLGLALAGAIARLHGGTLLLEDNQPGLRAVLELPAEKPSGPADEQRAG
jgi:signal transduction histidine kinase